MRKGEFDFDLKVLADRTEFKVTISPAAYKRISKRAGENAGTWRICMAIVQELYSGFEWYRDGFDKVRQGLTQRPSLEAIRKSEVRSSVAD